MRIGTHVPAEGTDEAQDEKQTTRRRPCGSIPTWFHGIVDYLTVGALLAVPRLLGYNGATATTLSVASGGLLGYNLCTRYQLGLLKWIPMPIHLTLDAMCGAALCAAPFVLPASKKQRPVLVAGFLAFGLMELFFALFTKTRAEEPFPGLGQFRMGQEVVEALTLEEDEIC